MRSKVYAYHELDTVTRRSRTGFLVFLDSAPIYWFLMKQTRVENRSFGSEFVAIKQLCDDLRGIIYKLLMIGIPVEGHDQIEGYNQSVLANTSI